jgi:hypothetical protein
MPEQTLFVNLNVADIYAGAPSVSAFIRRGSYSFDVALPRHGNKGPTSRSLGNLNVIAELG